MSKRSADASKEDISNKKVKSEKQEETNELDWLPPSKFPDTVDVYAMIYDDDTTQLQVPLLSALVWKVEDMNKILAHAFGGGEVKHDNLSEFFMRATVGLGMEGNSRENDYVLSVSGSSNQDKLLRKSRRDDNDLLRRMKEDGLLRTRVPRWAKFTITATNPNSPTAKVKSFKPRIISSTIEPVRGSWYGYEKFTHLIAYELLDDEKLTQLAKWFHSVTIGGLELDPDFDPHPPVESDEEGEEEEGDDYEEEDEYEEDDEEDDE